jgi:drug/metabolite transporter (DMT)-like permease
MADLALGRKRGTGGILLYLLPFVVINSFLYGVVKDSLYYSQPFLFMCIRFGVMTVIFLALFRKYIKLPDMDTMLVGIFSSVSGTFWILGLNYVSPADSAVLSYTMPFFALPLSYLLLKERLRWTSVLGALIGIMGTFIYSQTLPRGGETILGASLTVLNAFFFALFTVYYRKLKDFEIGSVLFWQSLISFLFFLPAALADPRMDLIPSLGWDIFYASVLGGVVMFYSWNMMSRSEEVGRVAALVYLVPVIVIGYQALEVGLLPSPVAFVGVFVMLFGVYTARYFRPRVELNDERRS